VTDLTVGSELLLRPIAPGFLGLSTENYALEAYAGRNPNAINPVFLQLVRGLAPRTPPVLRIGGVSADLAWIPTPGLRRPLGTRITLGRRLMDVLTATTRDLDARLILDLNLEADEPRLTAYEAATLVRRVGASHVLALELGNEPELYGLLPWGPTRRPGRPRGYTNGDYEREFDRFGALLPRLPLAGPSTGSLRWAGNMATFAATADRLSLLTMHRYGGTSCGFTPADPGYPTAEALASSQASQGLAQSVVPDARAAHEHGERIRVDELASASCRGAVRASDTFASALWALSTAFALASVGVDGVNFHTLPGASYQLFSFAKSRAGWGAQVFPGYYGLLMFALAAPPNSRLLGTTSSPVPPAPPASGLQMWAVRAPGGRINVVLVNPGGAATVNVEVPAAMPDGDVTYLRAPSLTATGGVSLGGRSFAGRTLTGTLLAPHETRLDASSNGYVVPLPAASAALLRLHIRAHT
jgi:hypothetical protein